jgi:2-iminobutanoate/2-iminopropanoate deaminase
MRSFTARACVIVLMAGPAIAAAAEERRAVRMKDRTDDRPYSDAVMAGNTLYLAGRIGLDPKTQKPPADAATEARNVLDQIKALLAQEGMTMDDLVSVQVFCSDVSLYSGFNDIYKGYFTKGYPARAFIGAGPLLFGARFEVQGIAVKR